MTFIKEAKGFRFIRTEESGPNVSEKPRDKSTEKRLIPQIASEIGLRFRRHPRAKIR